MLRSLPDTRLSSLLAELSLLPRQGLQCLTLLGSSFPIPDQNACPTGKTSSLLLRV